MADYIERGAVQEILKKHSIGTRCGIPCYPEEIKFAAKDVNNLPAADVAPVRHGRWIDKPTGRYGQAQSWCTSCGKRSGIGGIKTHRHKPYCPNCGALMDGGPDVEAD